MIHVNDEKRKKQKDFRCQFGILLKYMKYFEQALKSMGEGDDFDISVHCDIKIFEWLMLYIEFEERRTAPGVRFFETVGTKDLESKRAKPEIRVEDAISILISAEYLRIPRLVEECLGFFVNHINQILLLPLDLSCISNKLLKRMAGLMDLAALEAVSDKRDRILNRIFMVKLERLMEDESANLQRCFYCHQLFTFEQQASLVCPKADKKIFIDSNGQAIVTHVVDRSFDLNKFIVHLKKQRNMTWKQIFYKVLAFTKLFECASCGQVVNGPYLNHCSFHPAKPIFSFGSNQGYY